MWNGYRTQTPRLIDLVILTPAILQGKNIVRQGLKAAHTVEKGAMKAGKGLTKVINVSVKPREVKKE